MEIRPLISIPVLVYQNSHMIHNSLDSILAQDYENIEIIISDDCSDNFNQQTIEDYVQSRNCGNIKRLIINKNKVNLGTVKHCNKVINLSQGRYIKFVSADNALYDQHVISDFADFFEKTGALVTASQCLVYDETLTRVLAPAMSNDQISMLQDLTPRELFLAFIQNTFICALGVGFSRKFFEQYGPFDENYRIDEDRPMWLRISRMGCPIKFMNRITAKFRSGGISQQNARSYEQARIWYVEDLIKIWELEILPYREIIGDILWQKLMTDYIRQYEWPLTMSEPTPMRYF